MKFTEHMWALIGRRDSGQEGREIFRYNPKLAGRFFAAHLGLRVPDLVVVPFELEERPETLEPRQSFVLKPNEGSTSRGVIPCRIVSDPTSPPAWYRLLWPVGNPPDPVTTKEDLTWREIIQLAAYMREKWKGSSSELSGPWFAEELIALEPVGMSYAWKFYCIHGRPIWCRQLEMSGGREGRVRCWITPEDRREEFEGHPIWASIDCLEDPRGAVRDVLTNHEHQEPAQLPPPQHPLALYQWAQAVATEILERTGSPFVRVDMLEDAQGPVFNEITPHPSGGNDIYDPAWDEWLGQVWSDGE